MSQQLLTRLHKPENIKLVFKKLPTVVSLVLIVLCVYTVSQFVLIMLTDDESIDAAKNTLAKANPDKNSQQAFKQLTMANLFGVANQNKTTIAKKVPETRLNLFLKGVFAFTPMKYSSAIIASGKNGKEQSYGIGDKLAGGVTIKEIQSDYVILDRRGRSEILRMPESKGVGELYSAIPDLSDVMQRNSDKMLDIVRNKIIANPYSMRDYALPIVVKENNKQIGYRLQPQQKGGILFDVGLEPNDIVTAVNDVRLNDPKNATKALREMVTANGVNLTVRRGKVDLVIRVEIQ